MAAVSDLVAGTASWLVQRGTSLSKLCDALGLPPKPRRSKYTQAGVERTIKEYYATHGRRPRAHDLKGEQDWLYKRGSSVHRQCLKLEASGAVKENQR